MFFTQVNGIIIICVLQNSIPVSMSATYFGYYFQTNFNKTKISEAYRYFMNQKILGRMDSTFTKKILD